METFSNWLCLQSQVDSWLRFRRWHPQPSLRPQSVLVWAASLAAVLAAPHLSGCVRKRAGSDTSHGLRWYLRSAHPLCAPGAARHNPLASVSHGREALPHTQRAGAFQLRLPGCSTDAPCTSAQTGLASAGEGEMGRRDRFYLQGGGLGFGEEVCLPGEAPEQREGSRAVGGSPAGRWRELWGGPGWKGLTLGAFQGEGEQQRSLLGQ